MFTIRKRFHFSASHQLDHLPNPDEHKCARLHGHNYIVEAVLSSMYIDERGFVTDYADLDALKDYIAARFDHRHLNDVLGGSVYTTAEMLCWHFYRWLLERTPSHITVLAVRVSETPNTWAEFAIHGDSPSGYLARYNDGQVIADIRVSP